MDELERLAGEALLRIETAETPEVLEAVRVEVLGRKGILAQVSKDMGKLTADERSALGKLLNATKQQLEAALQGRQSSFEADALARKLDAEWVDLTRPAPGVRPASLHPFTQIQSEIAHVFMSMGFELLDAH